MVGREFDDLTLTFNAHFLGPGRARTCVRAPSLSQQSLSHSSPHQPVARAAAAFNSRHFCSPFISELTAAVTESKQDIDVCLFCVIMFMRFNFAENVM